MGGIERTCASREWAPVRCPRDKWDMVAVDGCYAGISLASIQPPCDPHSPVVQPTEKASVSADREREMPFSLGVFVDAREADATVSHGLGRFNRTVRARSVVAALEVMRAEYVLERARIAEAGWCHAEADVLGKQARDDVHG